MRSPNKWFLAISPDCAISSAARGALKPRFKALRAYLKLAAEHAEDDIEYVHQLRVAVRRCVAAVRLFQNLLPGHRRWLKKQCRKLRQAAGPARDLDVLAFWLKDVAVSSDLEAARGGLLEHVGDLRRMAQHELDRRHKKLPNDTLRRRMRELLRRLKQPSAADNGHEPTLAEDAPVRLEPIVADFLAAAQTDGADLAQLHQLRIQGKRLRYGLEAMAGAFPSEPFYHLYASVRELQERLGAINDRATAARYLDEWDSQDLTGLAALVRHLREKNAADLEAARQACAAWWTRERIESIRDQFARLIPALQAQPLSPKLYESA